MASCFVLVGTFSGIAAASARDFNAPASNDTSQQFPSLLNGFANVQRQDTPNDPGYDPAEPDDEDGGTATNLYDERFDLFGFPAAQTRTTTLYRQGSNALKGMVSGFNAAGAWKVTRGRSDVGIAVMDTGIKWDKESVRLQIRLNKQELPKPKNSGGGDCVQYDCNADGAFNVADYADDPRVSHTAGPHGSAQIDAEDLIYTFSSGTDGDNNGYIDDIAGWDFFDNDNNPYDASSYFAASGHGSGRAANAVERGNDGSGEIGTCPNCQVLPIRTWDTFVSDGNTIGMGMLYATDIGADVIIAANGSIYHSAFAEAASQYAYDHGVVQTYSGDDLNTANHNYPANYGHAMLIQGVATDTEGLGTDAEDFRPALCGPPLSALGACFGSTLPVGTYFRGANTTQFGGKSSIAMEGATGSENTGKAGGAAGLVISAARNHGVDLSPDETRAILEQTAERVVGSATDPTSNVAGLGVADPGATPSDPPESQWTSHFGWGRANLGDAVKVAAGNDVPPEAAINSPDWYAPLTGNELTVKGVAKSRFADNGGSFDWKLEWGAGQAPASWNMVAQGNSSAPVTNFGTIDLGQVRTALASYIPPVDSGGPVNSVSTGDPLKHEFAVRLIVTGDGISTPGIDRRLFTSAKDPDLRNGFPKRLGTGGEAPIRYADLNGDSIQELVVPTMAGEVHAYEPDGSELPGWPARTQLMRNGAGHEASAGFSALSADTPPREPPRGPVVADLDDDGEVELITAAGVHVYAWEADGSLRPGFPVSSGLNRCDQSLQSQPLSHPKCGFIASPAVARLRGEDAPLDIVIPGLDGYLYAFGGNGEPVPGYPVRLVDPDVPANQQMLAESINPPAIGDLNGDGRDDVVVSTNETYAAQAPDFTSISQGFLGSALTDVLANAAGGSNRVYAVDSRGNGFTGNGGRAYLPNWPIKLNGAIQTTLPLIGPGQDPSIAKVDGETRVVASATGSATIGVYGVDGTLKRGIQQGIPGAASSADGALPVGSINLFESASLGKLIPGTNPAVVKYGLGLPGVLNLLLVGQNIPYNHLIGAYDPSTGVSLPSFPRVTEDFQFLSSSNIANVNGSTVSNQVLAGTGLGLLNAYDGVTGQNVAGFPKVTGGWIFAPATLSSDGRMAAITREGYLFEWSMPDLPECQSEWPSYRHDQQQSGNYDRDGTPPGPLKGLTASSTGKLAFKATGDDAECGTADHYEVVTSDDPIKAKNFADAESLTGATAPGKVGTEESFSVASPGKYVAVRAIDETGNVGLPASAETEKTITKPPTKKPPKYGKPPKKVKPGVAFLYRGKLFLRVKCPKRFKPGCRVRAVVLTKKGKRGKAMSKPIRRYVRSNKFRRAALQIRKKYRARLVKLSTFKRKTIVLRLRIRSKRTTPGKRRTTVYHRLRVRRPAES